MCVSVDLAQNGGDPAGPSLMQGGGVLLKRECNCSFVGGPNREFTESPGVPPAAISREADRNVGAVKARVAGD
jgi:hypothetical protein